MSILNNSNSRQQILNKIEQALTQKTAQPFAVAAHDLKSLVQPSPQALALQFETHFNQLLGNTIFAENEADAINKLIDLCNAKNWDKVFCSQPEILNLANSNNWTIPLHPSIETCDVSFTTCEYLVARTGSIILSSNAINGRTASVYAPIHVCIAYNNNLVYDVADAIAAMQTKYGENLPSSITLATGPSRTADIEKTLVVGVHGPKEVFCVIIG
jgi:L-lactate dehydrogenase complex protein LldG